MAKTFTCERDGVVIRGESDNELVARVERHVNQSHPDLAGKLSRRDILAAATEIPGNKEIVLRWAEEVLNQGKVDVVDELFAEDFVWHMPFSPEPLRGPEAMKQTVAAFLAAFPDFAVDVEEVLAEGDKVALKYTASGTNDGELLGEPATGAPAAWPVMHVFTLRDGKVVNDVTVLDRLRIMEQLGRAQTAVRA
jgi:steroid delta-isomerase-like uncharacterized protein